MVFSSLFICALSAPIEKISDQNSTETLQEKSVADNHQVFSNISISSPLREKREDYSPASSPSDNKRTPALSQPDYQENKPPTFVFPVPVNQIIKNSNASPEIHS